MQPELGALPGGFGLEAHSSGELGCAQCKNGPMGGQPGPEGGMGFVSVAWELGSSCRKALGEAGAGQGWQHPVGPQSGGQEWGEGLRSQLVA